MSYSFNSFLSLTISDHAMHRRFIGSKLGLPGVKTFLNLLILICILLVVMVTTFSYKVFGTFNALSFLGRLENSMRDPPPLSASLREAVISVEPSATSVTAPETETVDGSRTNGSRHFDTRRGKSQTNSAGRQAGRSVSVPEDGAERHSKLPKRERDQSKNDKVGDGKPKGDCASESQHTPPKDAPANSSEAERRLKFQTALHWAGAPLVKGQPQWQMVDDNFTAFVYSAHYDDVDSPPLVRVVGIAQEFLPFSNVTCRYYGRPLGPSVHSVSGRLYHFRNRNKRRRVYFLYFPFKSSQKSIHVHINSLSPIISLRF